ncbi:hypothetical protein V5O48_006450 [Marasmius crinis-equi]|uniref:Uncharacterized protein n=1 Tax=Marasmius crinis-equi TaxID=585013 RepID=A0ABR3FJV6_9AGAR
MNSDTYNYQSISNPEKSTKNVFSFGLSTRPPAATDNRFSQYGTNTSNSSVFVPRGMKPSQQRPSFDQIRNEQAHSSRIFPPTANFQTPQRAAAKQEPTSPADLGDSYQMITPTSNTKSTEHFNQQKYRSQYESTQSHEYLPAPANMTRSNSRAPSLTPSNRSGSHNSEADDDDLELSDLMSRRMKEAKVVKSQLAEERVLTANLKSQVGSAQAQNSDLRKRLLVLENASETHEKEIAVKDGELKQMRDLLADAERAQQSQQALLDEREQKLAERSEHSTHLQKKLQECEERVAKVKDTAKRGIENLGRSYQTLQATLEQLKLKQDHSRKNLESVKDEIVDLKLTTTDQLKEVEPLLDPSGRYLLKSLETRNLVQELQNDRSDAQRVIDMLRDKLHFLGAQVVEYKEKVEIIENLRKEESVNLSRTAGLLEVASGNVKQLADKLCRREKEDAVLAAEGVKLELQVADSEERLAKMQAEGEAKDQEIASLNEQIRKLSLDLQLTAARLQDAVDGQKGVSERLESAQGRLRSQEQEVSALRGKLEASEKVEESLRTNLAKAVAKVPELEDLVRSADAAEAAANAKCEQVSEKVKTLEAEAKKTKKDLEEKLRLSDARIEKMGKELSENEERSNQANNRFAVLQDRFDSQTAVLKLAKEQSGDLQERLLMCEKANVSKLEASEGKHRTEVAVLVEQRSTLQTQLDQLQAKLVNLEGSSYKYKTENMILGEQKNSLQANLDRLREDYTKLEFSKAEVQTERNALQEAFIRSTEELSNLKGLMDKRNSEAVSEKQQTNNALQDALERARDHQKAHDDGLARASADFEERLVKQEQFSSKLLQAESKRAELAEKGLERASAQVHDLKTELSKLGVELQAMKDTAAIVQGELTQAQAAEVQTKETLARIETLEAENERLRRIEDSVQERYQDGQLTDSEKELVSLIMKTTQTMHEQDMVEKENDLRRRDNMIGSLQAKIDALESTLAKCLKNQGQGHEQEGQSKSMVDLNIWMSSSPLTDPASSNPQSRVLVSGTVRSEAASRVPSPKSPLFSQLAAEDDKSDQESKAEEPSRPNKKLKTAPARKVDQENEKKLKRGPGNARKRRN